MTNKIEKNQYVLQIDLTLHFPDKTKTRFPVKTRLVKRKKAGQNVGTQNNLKVVKLFL